MGKDLLAMGRVCDCLLNGRSINRSSGIKTRAVAPSPTGSIRSNGGLPDGDVVVEHGKQSGVPTLLDAETGGSMAKQIQCKPILTIDRRRLLASGTALAATGIAPKADPAKAVNAAEATMGAATVNSLPTTETPGWNVCAVTARRIEEIATRNRIRQEAGLPLLSIPRELRRMKETAKAEAFEAFAEVHREAVWEEVLAPMRQARGTPTWRPTRLLEGMGLQAKVSRTLRERFDASYR